MPNVHPHYICELVDACEFFFGDQCPATFAKHVAELASAVPAYLYKGHCQSIQAELGREEAVETWRRFQAFSARHGLAITDLENRRAANKIEPPRTAKHAPHKQLF